MKVQLEDIANSFHLGYCDTELYPSIYISLIESCLNKQPLYYIHYIQVKKWLKEKICSQISKANAPVTVLYSGGVDSTFLLLMARECFEEKDIRIVSIGYDKVDYDESAVACELGKKIGIAHREVHTIFPEFIKHFEYRTTQETYKDLFFSSSIVPTFAAFAAAKLIGNTIITGDGGDELFCGYDRYLLDYYNSKSGLFRMGKPFLSFILDKRRRQKLSRYNKYGYRGTVCIWDTDEMEELIPNSHTTNYDSFTWAKIFFYGRREKLNHLDNLMLMDIGSELFGVETRKVETAKRMSGVTDAMHPFLDLDVMKFCLSLPIEFKYRKRKRKWLLREIINEQLPEYEKIAGRKKRGFAVPIGDWFRSGTYLVKYCSKFYGDGIINDRFVAKILKEHLSGIDHSEKMWSIYIYRLLRDKGILEVV